MQRALARHAAGDCCVIPILLRPTYWEEAPFSTIQILPTDARPITSWSDHYEAFHDVAKNISKAIKALITSRIQRAKEQWINKGTSDYNVGRYEEAFAAFEQAVHLAPTDANAYICMGTALEKLERYNEALTVYVQAISLDPNNTTVYTNMNKVLDELNRCEETLNACEQAICLDPTDALNYYKKGTILYNLSQYEEALAALDQVIRLDPDNFDAYIEKGKILDALGRQTEARQAYDIAINMHMNNQLRGFQIARPAFQFDSSHFCV